MKKLTATEFLTELKSRDYDMRKIGDYAVIEDCTLDLTSYRENKLKRLYFGNGVFDNTFTWCGHMYFSIYCGTSTFKRFDIKESCNHFHCENALFESFGSTSGQPYIEMMHFEDVTISKIHCGRMKFRVCFLDRAHITTFLCEEGDFTTLNFCAAHIIEFCCDRAKFNDVYAEKNSALGITIHIYKTSGVRISNQFFAIEG